MVLNSVSLVCQFLSDNTVYSFSASTVPVLYSNNVKWRMKIFEFITCITKVKPNMENTLMRFKVLHMKCVEKVQWITAEPWWVSLYHEGPRNIKDYPSRGPLTEIHMT